MRCGCAGGGVGARYGVAAAARGFEGSIETEAPNEGGGPTGTPGGGKLPEGLDGGITPDEIAGTGIPAGDEPAAAWEGGGAAPFPRRAFKSIFGFFSSAIEPSDQRIQT